MLRLVLFIAALLAGPSFGDEFTMSAEGAMLRAYRGCTIHPVNDVEQMSDACKTLLAIRLLESVRESAEYEWAKIVRSYLEARERDGGEAPSSRLADELYEHVVNPEPEVAETPEPEVPGTCVPEDDETFFGYVMRASFPI